MKEFFQTQLAKLDIIKTFSAGTIMLALLLIVHALIYETIPEANKEALIHVLGIIEGGMIAIVSFYFGSSKSAEKKEDTKPPTV
jgi:hypothetical protein